MAVVPSRPLPPGVPADWTGARRLFEEATRGLQCRDILHVNSPTCVAGSLDMLKACLWGAAKYFIPFYTVSASRCPTISVSVPVRADAVATLARVSSKYGPLYHQ